MTQYTLLACCTNKQKCGKKNGFICLLKAFIERALIQATYHVFFVFFVGKIVWSDFSLFSVDFSAESEIVCRGPSSEFILECFFLSSSIKFPRLCA